MVYEILIAPTKGAVMQSLDHVKAVAGRGLVGDRNFTLKAGMSAAQNVTLIQSEKIDEFRDSTGLPFFSHDSRRNIVTKGIELNSFVGQEFYVGAVKLKALELCEPCSYLAKRTNRAVLWGLAHKGGLRCEIIMGGTIHLGDTIRP